MNEKIPLKRLAEKLGELSGVSEESAQQFIKSLFSAVADRLSNGETVEICGLGSFSVNPSLDDPVVFIPEQSLADEINAPFAMFESIAVGADISDEALVEICTRQSDDKDNMIEASEDVSLYQPVNDDASDHETPENDETETIEDVSQADVEESDKDSLVSENCDYNGADSDEADHKVESTAEDVTESGEMPESDEDKNIDENSDSVAMTSEDDETSETEIEESEPDNSTYIPEDEEEYVEYYDRPKSRFGIGFAVGLLTGLLIGALAFAAYAIFIVNSPA